MSQLIAHRHGVPVVLHDGRPVPEAGYCEYITWTPEFTERIREFADNGVRVFYLSPHPGEIAAWWGFESEGQAMIAQWPSRKTLAQQVETVLQCRPDALLVIRTTSTAPECWAAAHPEDVQTDEDGKRYSEGSLASPRYLRDAARYFGNLVRACEAQPWGERIVGYLDAPLGEGLTLLTIAGKMFDVSPANEQAFREWVCRRYAAESDLRAAWNRPDLTFDTVRVPRDRDWLDRRARGPATLQGQPLAAKSLPSNAGVPAAGLFHWIEAANAPAEHDYCRFQRDAFLAKFRTLARAIQDACAAAGRRRLVGFDITKQPLMGWQILSSFDGLGDGQSFPNALLLSGSYDTAELLDDDLVDVIFTPADYHARTLGFAYEAEGLSDSLLLRGKAMIIENDARNFVGQGLQDQGAFRTLPEVEAGLLRNAGLTMSRGLQSYWCNVGSSYFHDPGIQRVIGKLVPVLDRHQRMPRRETRDAIAFVIDDESLLTEDFTSGYQTLAVIWQRILGLAHCGVPYRIVLLSDLHKAALPDYKVWFFPNLFVVNDAVLALLRAKVLRNGNLALFGPSTGISDGRVLGAEGATRLLGVPMDLHPRTTVRHVIVQHSGHPITGELPASLTFGDSLPYGPTLMPGEWAVEKAGGAPLGHATACWFIHRTGLFLKEEGLGTAGNGRPGARGANDYGVLWSCAMPLPSNLLRAACRYAGCHVWCEDDDVVYASDSMACLHSVKAGPRTLAFPGPRPVWDLVSGEKLGDALSSVSLTIAPPETRLFGFAAPEPQL
jgi:hypothetical protein